VLRGLGTIMSFVDHPRFAEVAPFFVVEVYDRDGGHTSPRVRLEVHPPDATTGLRWLTLAMPCVECGAAIHPIRQRAGESARGGPKKPSLLHLYFAPTCPLAVSLRCSRGAAARDEYIRVRRAVDLAHTLPARVERALHAHEHDADLARLLGEVLAHLEAEHRSRAATLAPPLFGETR